MSLHSQTCQQQDSIDRSVLDDALISVVRRLRGKNWRRTIVDLRKKFDIGAEPDFAKIAETLHIDLEKLLVEFSAQILLRTGELIAPMPRMH